MNRTSGRDDGVTGESSQRSVAELLARYGDPSPGGRRHRRRAADTEDAGIEGLGIEGLGIDGLGIDGPGIEDVGTYRSYGTVPRSTIGRVESDRGHQVRPARTGHRRAAEPSPAPAPRSSPPSFPPPSFPPRGAGAERPVVRNHRAALDEDTRFDPPAVSGGPFAGRPDSDGPSTDQIPRIEEPIGEPAPAPAKRDDRLRGQPPAGLAPRGGPPTMVPPPEPDTSADAVDELPSVEPDVDPDLRAEPEAAASPAREWAVVASQVGLGVVGGAVLWLVCEWLWQSIPVLALVVALLVITGLVWVVRYVRRAEDLQTTVIAVLVGLFVTVSPAALLLVDR